MSRSMNKKKKQVSLVTKVQAEVKEFQEQKSIEKCWDKEEDISSDEMEDGAESDLEEEGASTGTVQTQSPNYHGPQRMIRHLRFANPTTSVLILTIILDFPLDNISCHVGLKDEQAIPLLLNLLDTQYPRCQEGALKILKELVRTSPPLRRDIIFKKGLPTMMKLICGLDNDIRMLVAETFSYLSRYRLVRPLIRKKSGIPILIDFLDIPERIVRKKPAAILSNNDGKIVRTAKCAAYALWSLSHKNDKNKQEIRRAGTMQLLGRLINSGYIKLIVPIVGFIQECASSPDYQILIRVEGLLEIIIEHLNSEDSKLKILCTKVLFKCAEEESSRNIIARLAMTHLVNILKKDDVLNEKELVLGTTGALWKCSLSPSFVDSLMENGAIPALVKLLNNQPEEVLVNVVGALGLCAKDINNCSVIRQVGAVQAFINLCSSVNPVILKNIAQAIGACAHEPESLKIIYSMDAVRLLWSLLKNKDGNVVSSSAWALCPCVRFEKDSGHIIRSFVGGLELLVRTLHCQNPRVLAATCALICEVAKDHENLGVITDYGIVALLSSFQTADSLELQRYQSAAIAVCSPYRTNCKEFGEKGVIIQISNYLKNGPIEVKREAIAALYQLSFDPKNCIIMNRHNVEEVLLSFSRDPNSGLIEMTAKCLENIRKLAFEIDIHLWYERFERRERKLKLRAKRKKRKMKKRLE